MSKFVIQEKFADKCCLPHYELINSENGKVLWEGNEKETFYGKDKFIKGFAQHMMNLSNRLNEFEDEDGFRDDHDIKEDYLPKIRQFIAHTTGL
jgi:hypothetical protein